MIKRRAFIRSSAASLVSLGPLASLAPLGLRGRAAAKPANIRQAQAPGARAPIEILDDEFGIAHIRARSKHDAFFGQGYAVARDRLFQIDLQHRRALGRMAEAFGARFLPHDRLARLFVYRGDIEAELKALPPEVLDCARGYVAGINARIGELEADPAQLPLEYGALGIKPLRWDVRDLVVSRDSDMGDAREEILRCQLHSRGMLDLYQLMDPLRPQWQFTVPEGLDYAAVSEADLGMLSEGTRPLPFTPADLAFYDPELERMNRAAYGSNAWTVAGSRTASGRPILANDPHLSIGGASPRHIAHLTAPGLDVIGGGEPGLPGIMQGHNAYFAFGRTNFHIDQTDLFVLQTADNDPQHYWHNGQWKAFETYEEEIPVKGVAPERVVLRYSQGRPVISQDPERRRAVALASVSMLPGALMKFAMIAINLAHDWDSLRQAVKIHVSPTNLHYADTAGNTGWHAIGFVPKRPKHDGLLPAPGDGRYDWNGILKVEEMPNVLNPREGWFASANQLNLPPDYPYKDHPVSFSWSDPYRYNRIKEVLQGQPHHRIEDSIALQHDVQSLPARELLKMLPATPAAEAAPAAALLRGWNCEIGEDSAAALLYEMVMPELSAAFREQVLPEAARELIRNVNLSQMLRLLGEPDSRFGTDPVAGRDALINKALVAGWAKAVKLAGSDPAQWRWGDVHHVNIAHPLNDMPAIAAAFPKIENGRSGGDSYTVMARGTNPRNLDVTHGASYLLVADVGHWDNSRVLLLPGQSADPRSPHYRDFYPLWLSAKTQPLRYSRAAVDAAAVTRWVLTPA